MNLIAHVHVCFWIFIFTLVLDHMDVVALKAADNGLNFKLREGFSAETSGKALEC